MSQIAYYRKLAFIIAILLVWPLEAKLLKPSKNSDEKEILNIIKKNYEQNNIILDPHTAVGVGAANKLSFNDCVVLSTAHPCKFPDVTKKAINKHENLPKELQNVLDKDEHFQVLKNNIQEVKNFVMKLKIRLL